MRVYRTAERGTDMMMAGFGQSPAMTAAAKLALDNSVEWPANMAPETLVGMLAVRVDGSQIARLGWTVGDTDHLVFRNPDNSPWVVALVFEGTDWGKTIFIDSKERSSWKLVRTPYNDQLYITMTLPNRFESEVTLGTFAAHVENAYAQMDKALEAESHKETSIAKGLLDEKNVGAKGHRDSAIQEARILMTLGTLDLDDAKIVQSIIDQVTKDVGMTEMAVVENKGIDSTHALLAADIQILGDRFDQLAESGVVRGLAYYLILGAYQDTQNYLLPYMPPVLQPQTTEKIQATNAARQEISKSLGDVGIDAQGAVTAMQGLGMLGDVNDVGQLWTAIKGFLGKVIGSAWRGKAIASTGKEMILYEEKAAATTAAGWFSKLVARKTVGEFFRRSVETLFVGIVFGYSNVIFSKIYKPDQATMVDEYMRQYRAQQEAIEKLSADEKKKLATQNKATGNGLRSDYITQDGMNKANPDPGTDARLKEIRARLAAFGVDTSEGGASAAMPWILGGLAAAGVGYLVYRRSQEK